MRSKSLDIMTNIKEYAERFYLEHGRSPYKSEIAEEIGFTKGTAAKYLAEMRDRGMIEYDGYTIHDYENYSAGNGWLFFEETVYTYDVKMENGIYFIDLTVVECKNQYGEQSNYVKPGDKEKYYIELSGDSVTMIYNDDQKLRFE